jgi:Pregnancy-associated plasma protein-A
MRRSSRILALAVVLWGALAVESAGADICQRRARRCSTPPRPAAKASQSERAIAAANRLQPGERIVVPIVYHVVYGSYGTWPQDEPDDLAHAPALALTARQTRALNRAFRGTGISFWTVEATLQSFAPWADPGRLGQPSVEELEAMVHDLTADRPEVLHVFLMRQAENRAAAAESKSMFDGGSEDGIIMDWDYLPYVEALRPTADPKFRRLYYEGETLVHLVGHYAGLLHTFEAAAGDCNESCAQTSDAVHDTPPHRWLYDEDGQCVPLDTCKAAPGMDPMTNYMNLEPDLCASEFTPGQVERMERMVRRYRPYLIVPAANAR